MLPQVSFLIGPIGSGKSTLGRLLCERTNAKQLNFSKFVAEHGLTESEDDVVVMALIQQLALEISPRVVIEDFP
jgi:shikimate kinase